MSGQLIITDENNRVVPVAGGFITADIDLAGTAFTDNDLDVPANAVEARLISDADFEIAEAVDGDGFPVAANEEIMIGIADMAKIWLKGANLQKIRVLWHRL